MTNQMIMALARLVAAKRTSSVPYDHVWFTKPRRTLEALCKRGYATVHSYDGAVPGYWPTPKGEGFVEGFAAAVTLHSSVLTHVWWNLEPEVQKALRP